MGELRKCDDCENISVRKSLETQHFKYGEVELTAIVPVWICEVCGEAYTEGEAEEIRDAAINEYLKHKKKN